MGTISPWVALSIVANLLPQRALSFLRAGAGAVVGCWWPVSARADAVFSKTLYELLDRRMSFGDAVLQSRLAVRRDLPNRPDWLAYTLFGTPRARTYRPEISKGYTALECLNPDEPLQPGKDYTFRVSIHAQPPMWHRDRLVKTMLPEQDIQAMFIAPLLLPESVRVVPLEPLGRSRRQASITLQLPQSGAFPLLVELVEDARHLETLQLILTAGEAP